MKNIFTIIIFSILTSGHLYSQSGCCPYISNCTIIPTNPTTNDVIKIVTRTHTPSLGKKLSYTYSQLADTFNLIGCFWRGLFTQPMTFIDTTIIGKLTAGTYFINYIAYSSSSSTSCSVEDTNSIATSFQVNTLSGLENLNVDNSFFSIYPNPFSEQTVLQTKNFLHDASLTIGNYLGQTVAQINKINGQTIIFNRESIPSGLYFIHLTQDGKIIATSKLVITDN
jgi:hypothetical protein